MAFDLTGNGTVSQPSSGFGDMDELVLIILNTYYGDSNLDGAFNSGDITFAFQGGEYDDGDNNNSGWTEGDWNGDGDFDSSDFSFAFGEGGYDQPNRSGGAFATHQTIIGYTGRPLDLVTGLQNNLNRWYDARTGRWISEDPIGFAAGDANLYRYVGNSPIIATDPRGLESFDMLACGESGATTVSGSQIPNVRANSIKIAYGYYFAPTKPTILKGVARIKPELLPNCTF